MTLAQARGEDAWLDDIRTLVARGNWAGAAAQAAMAIRDWPESVPLLRAAAGIHQHEGSHAEAEQLLRRALDKAPRDVATAFELARICGQQGRAQALADVLGASFKATASVRDPNLVIAAIELLDESNRKQEAAVIAEAGMAAHPLDARLHAYAGMLDLQIGEFERARRHYAFALDNDPRAWEWHAPLGLSAAQRYQDRAHPDCALFERGLRLTGISPLARAELHFCLGKFHDDLAEVAAATEHFRQANAIRHRLTPWSRKTWRRAVEARLAAQSVTAGTQAAGDFVPIFVVGLPRTGTTLLASLLSRHQGVCNRGELPWLARLAQQADLATAPAPAALQRAAATYARHARQDDAADARWFVDKQPLNFRYVDLALAMFPQAKILHCRRDPRDTALSLWTQCFLEDVQGYSYDFGDIGTVMRDERRLIEHWKRRHPESIRTVDYEDLVADPGATMATLSAWIGLPVGAVPQEPGAPAAAPSISTASLWQARQPIHSRSVGRWRAYAATVPELLRLP